MRANLRQYTLLLAPPLVVITAVVVSWQAVTVLFDVPSAVLPSPALVWKVLTTGGIDWSAQTSVTLWETVLGFVIAIVTGIPLGLGIVYFSWLNRAIYPILVAVQLLPKIAIAPIIFALVGFGFIPRALIVYMVAFFPVVIQTVAGLNAMDPGFAELFRSIGASKFQVFRLARLPNAMPYIMDGLKVAMTLALIGAVVAEFVQSNSGLGYAIIASLISVGTPVAYAAMVLLSILGYALFLIVLLAERMLIPWYVKSKRERV